MLPDLSFRSVVLLFPVATVLHVIAALGIATAFHALEVGHNVFARW